MVEDVVEEELHVEQQVLWMAKEQLEAEVEVEEMEIEIEVEERPKLWIIN
jgi:hypothetical protein